MTTIKNVTLKLPTSFIFLLQPSPLFHFALVTDEGSRSVVIFFPSRSIEKQPRKTCGNRFCLPSGEKSVRRSVDAASRFSIDSSPPPLVPQFHPRNRKYRRQRGGTIRRPICFSTRNPPASGIRKFASQREGLNGAQGMFVHGRSAGIARSTTKTAIPVSLVVYCSARNCSSRGLPF